MSLSSSSVAAIIPACLFLLLSMVEICLDEVAFAGLPVQTDAASIRNGLKAENCSCIWTFVESMDL
jgi:hypothetical protein